MDRTSDMVFVLSSVPVTIMNRSVDTGCGPKAVRHLKVWVMTDSHPLGYGSRGDPGPTG